MKCHLCLQERELCESHIIPEFFYRDSYDAKHKMSILKEHDPRTYRSIKGEYEKLLCAECEVFLNRTYENYFDNFWYRKRTLPTNYQHDVFVVKGMDWIKFRLLMLSILWRASIPSRQTFSKISLGEREERIRVMIKNQDPLDFLSYQIFGWLLLFPGTKRVMRDFIIPPFMDHFDGIPVSISMFGGCIWYCVIADKPLTRSFALSPYGVLQLPVHDAFDVKPIVSLLEDRFLLR